MRPPVSGSVSLHGSTEATEALSLLAIRQWRILVYAVR